MNNTDVVNLSITGQEFCTILAALRYYQAQGLGDPDNRPLNIHEIATDCGELLSSLDDEGIDELAERINCEDACSDPWVEDDDYPFSDWRYQVNNGDTTQGYKQWAKNRRAEDADDL